MTVPWGGFPDGTFDDDLSGLAGLDEASWRAGLYTKVIGSSGGGRGFNGLSSFLGGLLGTVDGHGTELADLQDKTQKLEGVIGYAHGYINGGWSGQLGLAKRSIDRAIGPTVGVTRASGAYYLNSKGLWVADARLNVNTAGFGVGTTTELHIRVYSPGGSLHATAASLATTAERHCHSVHLPFTVPSAGYYVEFWADVPLARDALGGSHFNGFSVEKRSMETS